MTLVSYNTFAPQKLHHGFMDVFTAGDTTTNEGDFERTPTF